ncbi:MAG: hypothetical protein R3C05_25295 [Pirellulaceae bacterium]
MISHTSDESTIDPDDPPATAGATGIANRFGGSSADQAIDDPLAEPLGESLQKHSIPQPPPPEPKSSLSQRFDAAKQLPHGGWYNDPLRLAIRYQASGHGDSILASLLAIADTAPAIASEDRDAILKMPAVAACRECHPSVTSDDPAAWRATAASMSRGSFTRFRIAHI